MVQSEVTCTFVCDSMASYRRRSPVWWDSSQSEAGVPIARTISAATDSSSVWTPDGCKKGLPATIMHMHACKSITYIRVNYRVRDKFVSQYQWETPTEGRVCLLRGKARGSDNHRSERFHSPRWRNRCVVKARDHRSPNVCPVLRCAPL